MADPEGYTIDEAARIMDLAKGTVRRYITKGSLKAEQRKTKFGDQWFILEIPDDLQKNEPAPRDQKPAKRLDADELYQDNQRLVYELALAHSRIASLEEQVLLLEAPKQGPQRQPWYKRLFSRS